MDTDNAKTQVADVVESAREKTQDQADRVLERGRGVVRAQVDSRSSQAGEQAQSLARTLRDTAGQLRESGDEEKARHARLADEGAQRLERAGNYLTTTDADELLGKAEDVARKQPWLVAGAGLLLGVAVARVLKASSSERYRRSQAAYTAPPESWEPATVPELDGPRPIVTPAL